MFDSNAPVAPVEFIGPVQAKKRGRPAKHADAAAKQRAFREAHKIVGVRLDGKLAGTIAKLADQFDTDQTLVVNNLLRFALANKNWSALGLGGWAVSDARFGHGRRACVEPTDEQFNDANI